jgi:ferritin-like metal-binding protein YciE
MAIQNPRDLFLYQLCAMYDIERKLDQMLPILAQESLDAQAREAFMQHEQETRQHISNLEQCFQMLGSQPLIVENYMVAGLRRDHDTFLQQQPPAQALSMFGLYAGYQSESLEIAGYHNLIDAANSIGLSQCVPLLQQNLQQEIAASQKLAALAHQLGLQQTQLGQAPVANQPVSNQPPAGANQPMPNRPSQVANQPMPNQPSQAANQPPRAPNPPLVNQSSGTANPSIADEQTETANAPAANTASQVREGMDVVGSDMRPVGVVRNVRDNDFRIDIPMQRDLYAPFDAVQNVTADRVILNIPADQVRDMNWSKPSLMG